MLNSLEQRSESPGLDMTASFGPFSVFQVDLCGAQSIANNQNTSKPQPYEGSSNVLVDCEERDGLSLRNIDGDIEHWNPSPRNAVAPLFSPASLTYQLSECPGLWINKLLSHYTLRITDISQPINHPQNPYRSIHAQYAMEVWTESLNDKLLKPQTGYSNRRVAFYSILASAAFHLRGFSIDKRPNWKHYDYIGKTYRWKALLYMQRAMEEPSFDAESHCARMSAFHTLVDSDILEGTSGEVFTHLQACHQIRQLYLSKTPRPSPDNPRIRQLDTNSFFIEMIALTTAHHRPELWQFSSYVDAASLIDTPFATTDTCLEHTYGITSSIASTIFLINKFWYYTNSATIYDELYACELGHAIAAVAIELRTWTPLSESYASVAIEENTSLSLAMSLASSFCYSALIYFHSCFLFDPPQSDESLFSRLSHDTLLALERAECESIQMSKVGAMISWPAFVAGCYSPPELRQRWTRYWSTLLKFRIGSIQAAWEIVQRVWRKERREETATTEDRSQVYVTEQATFETYCCIEPIWTWFVKDSGATIVAL
ncbi:hypothetical protein P154DRAFT_614685 [Amniculicola lignicola CBS 123094]|uniref:Transcription factor domain-containing protein n=1 Tax=Amniculicola lignicola CBS 123094 TaxID=1392246 RepID=A0A6A5X2J6_9PLEO|nr:hypothetical protein P154DRAFT_614685 [Amniculicola lignicola CBS 123094]